MRYGLGSRVRGSEFRFGGSGFRGWGLGIGDYLVPRPEESASSWFRVWNLEFRVYGLWRRVQGLGFRVWGVGFRV